LSALLGWCGKNTKITTPAMAMTTTDCAAKTVAMRLRVRASCRAPRRYGNLSFIFFFYLNDEKKYTIIEHAFIKRLAHYQTLLLDRPSVGCDESEYDTMIIKESFYITPVKHSGKNNVGLNYTVI